MTYIDQHLTPTEFYILVVLSARDLYVSEIVRWVNHYSDGELSINPRTAYHAIDRLRLQNLIETTEPAIHYSGTDKLSYYKLTHSGKGHLETEVRRMRAVLSMAEELAPENPNESSFIDFPE
jgi:DNA-binding PadR family transcriptional regulator